jgi:hypothetical protein
VAKHIAMKARAENCDIQDSVKALKELKDLYAILTEGKDKGDKEPSRRPTTMAAMRERLALVPNEVADESESE